MKQLKRIETVYALIIGLLLMAAMSVMAQPDKALCMSNDKIHAEVEVGIVVEDDAITPDLTSHELPPPPKRVIIIRQSWKR